MKDIINFIILVVVMVVSVLVVGWLDSYDDSYAWETEEIYECVDL